eukprot:NODE_7148_length_585_cov_9.184701_g6148_i0.p5 GENE.NODE_7148_length_585_cov_9.184701_g6148_i0~~NODE_7148_length_585_cov_9.184701_g6148_i0.p5  ORF type:complete len:55 (+),score=8.55 NODE_7148_length_585_cov_9.184701_g6148_i0:26-166(+)
MGFARAIDMADLLPRNIPPNCRANAGADNPDPEVIIVDRLHDGERR